MHERPMIALFSAVPEVTVPTSVSYILPLKWPGATKNPKFIAPTEDGNPSAHPLSLGWVESVLYTSPAMCGVWG